MSEYRKDPKTGVDRGSLYGNRQKRKAEGAKPKKLGTPSKVTDSSGTRNYSVDPKTGVNKGSRYGKRQKSKADQEKFGITPRKRGDAPRQDGSTAKGKDGVTRRYDAATKTWKIVK